MAHLSKCVMSSVIFLLNKHVMCYFLYTISYVCMHTLSTVHYRVCQ